MQSAAASSIAHTGSTTGARFRVVAAPNLFVAVVAAAEVAAVMRHDAHNMPPHLLACLFYTSRR